MKHLRTSTALLHLAGAVLLAATASSCNFAGEQDPVDFDAVIRGGRIYDGSGGEPLVADVAILGDRIATIGSIQPGMGKIDIDARGLAVAPGFINMLSWATESLIKDGRSQGDIRQGVTLEVFGEGWSMGPLNDQMKEQVGNPEWTTLMEYLEHLEHRGISPNVASFVGATTVRIHEIGHADRPPTGEELLRMQELVRREMEQGALGVGSSLIYSPAFYARTDELIALCRIASEFGGMYISHLRSEGNSLLEALEELITIAREADIPAEIYHLKAAGRENWGKLADVIRRVEQARAEGLRITADIYPYTAGATGLAASIPPWAHEGGHAELVKRLRDPATRSRILEEMSTPSNDWENLYLAAGSPDNVLLVGFRNKVLRHLLGKSLAEAAALRGSTPLEAALDLIVEDDSRIECVYFIMSDENLRRKLAIPWVSFCSDSASMAAEGEFLEQSTHPRAYGAFARVLGRFVRDERVIRLGEAIRRLTTLPAANLGIRRRGTLKEGYFADLVVFDPKRIQDHATYESPHQYATGMVHVFVNGRQVLRNGEHTGALPGRIVRGPGAITAPF